MNFIKRVIPLMILVTLLYTMIYSPTGFASTGARTDPYSGYIKRNLISQEYSFYAPKKIVLNLVSFIHGAEANNIVNKENMFNDIPAIDEEWILLKYHIRYVSGPNEPLDATSVIYYSSSFYTSNSTAINPRDTAAFSGVREGLSQYDVNMYPGGESDVWYGMLVKKTVGYPLYRVATGYDENAGITKYTWFSTNPNYKESSPSITAPTSLKAVSASYNSIKLTWAAVAGANGYGIYRSTGSTGKYTLISNTSSNSYLSYSLLTGTIYNYRIKAYRTVGIGKVYGNLSSAVSAKPIPATISSITAARYRTTSIKISWAAIIGSSGYELYRSTASKGTYSLIKATTAKYFTNTGLATGRYYYYKVRAYRWVGKTKVYGAFSVIKYARP